MDTDVIVVGAGPTGLMLAGELRLGGARVVVVERLPEPTGQSRGLGFTARAMEVFDQRGLLPMFGDPQTSARGHFGGVQFDFGALEDGHFGVRDVPQYRTEAVLERWASRLGADIRRGWELEELTDHGDAVEITARTPRGPRRLRAPYLVGCDGGGSTVRKLAGFDFPGTPATREMFLADVSGGVRPRPLGERLPGGMVMVGPLEDGVDRLIICEHGTPPPQERTRDLEFADLAAAWRRITGEDIGDRTASWVSSFTDATRQVTRYRQGRVLLAGDAAHIHLPAGGQGLSAGVQDAANLGWKLAAHARGWAPAGLLDSYHTERHPAGARLLMNTRAQGLLYLGGPEVEPLREVFSELLAYDEVKRHLAGMVSGLDIRYDVGPGEHPLLGRRLPPRPLVGEQGETSTMELLHAGRGVLLDPTGDPGLRSVAQAWGDRVTTVNAVPRDRDKDGLLATPLLIRPDGHVVWAASDEPDPSDALHRWFGPGSASSPAPAAELEQSA